MGVGRSRGMRVEEIISKVFPGRFISYLQKRQIIKKNA